jgi:hypothetical protein
MWKGDVEVLMNLPTYIQTAICTLHSSEILVLNLKNFERMIAKRHIAAVELMRENLLHRLEARLSPRIAQSVPLLRCLLDQALAYQAQRLLRAQTLVSTNIIFVSPQLV